MLTIENLDAGYGKLQILRGVSLEVSELETVALIGANGAGKTTVLKAIMGLAQVMGGRITFYGTALNGLPWYKIAQLGVAFVPQKREVFAPLTVMENLEVGAYRIRRNKAEVRQRLEMALDYFPHLKPKLSQSAGYLSGGEQKMLSIARGIVGSPRMLLLDEPSLGLAPSVAEDIFDKIGRIARDHPSLKATIIVEQNAFLALETAERGYVLEGGEVVLAGSSADLIGNPHVKKAYLTA
ncbi:MAG: ABC transporter ATP-binding protein [Chloroflexota bacterium]